MYAVLGDGVCCVYLVSIYYTVVVFDEFVLGVISLLLIMVMFMIPNYCVLGRCYGGVNYGFGML